MQQVQFITGELQLREKWRGLRKSNWQRGGTTAQHLLLSLECIIAGSFRRGSTIKSRN